MFHNVEKLPVALTRLLSVYCEVLSYIMDLQIVLSSFNQNNTQKMLKWLKKTLANILQIEDNSNILAEMTISKWQALLVLVENFITHITK